MSWRVVVVSSNAKLDYKLDYLVVRTIDEVKRVHLSEIGVLVLESTAISLTSYLLCELIQHKIKVVFCDHKRNPCSELVPVQGSHESSGRIRQQLAWSPQFCQKVWTEIVREKLHQQYNHLRYRQLAQAELIKHYEKELQFNDVTNREAHAAKVYFNALFGQKFTRTQESPLNSSLNYGYTLLLSAINREISAGGYLNQLGLFHNNNYNPFNLACDLIEPLRPIVDKLVVELKAEEFGKNQKRALLEIFQQKVSYKGKSQVLLYALRLYCNGVFRSLQNENLNELHWIEYEW